MMIYQTLHDQIGTVPQSSDKNKCLIICDDSFWIPSIHNHSHQIDPDRFIARLIFYQRK